jgi:hypothetical protein
VWIHPRLWLPATLLIITAPLTISVFLFQAAQTGIPEQSRQLPHQAQGRLTMINKIIDFSVEHKFAALAVIAPACIGGEGYVAPRCHARQVIIFLH